ncbi:MAG: DUF1800 domain-containing protein [Planctomycetes bacterium]|nr:DUF1800 domain-containing protein [Planctomycetota bacterium]MCB9868336.1 DUF1800 domain-containing protein [Planctomycetota bacterium]
MRMTAHGRLANRLRRRNLSSKHHHGGGTGSATQVGTAKTGGGSPSTSRQGTVDFELSPWIPTTVDPFDAKKAAHLLRRAGFGAMPTEIDAILKVGVHRTVDLLTIPSNWGLQEYGSQMLPSGEVINVSQNVAYQRAQWVFEAVTTHFPLKEKMALFWHDHFSVGINNNTYTPMSVPHVNIFRRHGLGKFRDVLVEVARDPAMLFWLDNRINGASGRINENWGRELNELYTQGEGSGYTESDVKATSACFAGWSLINYNKYFYNTTYARAGAGSKTLLGQTIYNPTNQEQEGYQAIDVLLSQKATSEYVVRKIWSYFVAERPETNAVEQKLWDDIVVELAKRWKESGYDIRGLMSVILRCNYFNSSRAMRKLVKNPMEYTVGAIRALGAPTIGRYSLLGTRVELMGLPLFRYSNPSGLSDGTAWIDSQALINRYNFVDDLTQVSTTADFRTSWDPLVEVQRKSLYTSKAIVDHFVSILVDDAITSTVRQNLYDYMDYIDGTPTKQYVPYDSLPTNSQYRPAKIRGLVALIMILPEFNIN